MRNDCTPVITAQYYSTYVVRSAKFHWKLSHVIHERTLSTVQCAYLVPLEKTLLSITCPSKQVIPRSIHQSTGFTQYTLVLKLNDWYCYRSKKH